MPTIEKDKTQNKMDAHHLIYKLLRPGDLATDERVEELFNVTFFDTKRFDLGKIARMKMERKL
jgi:DNA-directed RNA polymerase subunit beta